MTYDLDLIESTCSKLGLNYIGNEVEIEVSLDADITLVFANAMDESDTYLGFKDTPWHSHGNLMLMTGDTTYVEYDPSELLKNIIAGQVVVATRYIKGKLQDRWLTHRDERMNLQDIEPDEEFRIYRVAASDTDGTE